MKRFQLTAVAVAVAAFGLTGNALGQDANLGSNAGLGQTATAPAGMYNPLPFADNINIGGLAGSNQHGVGNVNAGWKAGLDSVGNANVAVGPLAGHGVQGSANTNVGATSGENSVGDLNSNFGNFAGNNTTGNYNTAIGNAAGQGVNGTGNFAAGLNAGNGVNGQLNVSIGYQANNDKTTGQSVAIGALTSADDQGVAIGTRATAGTSGVALGNGSVANANEVSVGAAGAERKITNVAPGAIGATSTDAVNGSQLYATNTQVGINSQDIQLLSEQTYNLGNTVNSNTAAIGDLQQSVAGLNDRLDHTTRELRGGIAAAMAVASIPQPMDVGRSMVGVGTATWEGRQGFAVGASHAFGLTRGAVVVKVAATGSDMGGFGGSVGAGLQFGG